MKNKKFDLISIIAGTLVLFISGWIIGKFILEPLQGDHTISYGSLVKEESIIWLDVLAQIPIAFILTFLCSRYVSPLTVQKGIVIGALALAMFNLSSNLLILSQWNLINVFVLITDAVGAAIIGALGGGAIAWILQKANK